MAAREPLFAGQEVPVLGATAFVGNGIHPDGDAHLQAGEYIKAEKIGETLDLSEGVILIAPSPLARAVETAVYMFVGMARRYARDVIGSEDKKPLSERGLHKSARFQHCIGLAESVYKNSQGDPDEGNELVAEAYHKGINPSFSRYRWMVQKGFEHDSRSEHPQDVADRGLRALILAVLQYDTVLSSSHQPNLEVITAALTGHLGNDGNEVFERAGGAYGLGGGFELRVYETAGKISEARLIRTKNDPRQLEQELVVDMETLLQYSSS